MATGDFESALRDCTMNEPASESAVSDLERAAGFRLPSLYRELFFKSNGLEGFVEENYLVLWPIEQLAELNDAYCVSQFAPGLFLIGSNGGNTGYAIDTRTEGLPVVEVPLVGMSHTEAKRSGNNIGDFLEKLRRE